MRAVAEAFATISTSVAQAKRLVDDVSGASQQQTQGIDQVSKAIGQLEQLTQRTAANSEECAAASEELNTQAEVTMSVVARLQAFVGGKARAEADPGRRRIRRPRWGRAACQERRDFAPRGSPAGLMARIPAFTVAIG